MSLEGANNTCVHLPRWRPLLRVDAYLLSRDAVDGHDGDIWRGINGPPHTKQIRNCPLLQTASPIQRAHAYPNDA